MLPDRQYINFKHLRLRSSSVAMTFITVIVQLHKCRRVRKPRAKGAWAVGTSFQSFPIGSRHPRIAGAKLIGKLIVQEDEKTHQYSHVLNYRQCIQLYFSENSKRRVAAKHRKGPRGDLMSWRKYAKKCQVLARTLR